MNDTRTCVACGREFVTDAENVGQDACSVACLRRFVVSESAKALAKKRWDRTSGAQRREYALRMVAARRRKAGKKAVRE